MNPLFDSIRPIKAGTALDRVLTARRMNAIQDLLRQLWAGQNINSGGNVMVVPSANGPTVNVIAGTGSGSTAPTTPQNTAFDVDVTAVGSAYRLDVHPGTINGLLPTNYNLSHTTASPAEVVYLVITCSVNNGALVSAALSFASAPSEPVGSQLATPPAQFGWTLGLLNAGKWYKLVAGSLVATPHELFRVAKPSFSPGELPYDAYYTWAVSYV